MKEAVEICKLRLFLKLVAQLSSVNQIEPMPDIDFNIRVGNTLVGFTSEREAVAVIKGDVWGDDPGERIGSMAKEIGNVFDAHRRMQITSDVSAFEKRQKKENLKEKLGKLGNELDIELSDRQGIDVNDANKLNEWKENTRPFHWFVEHYGMLTRGGFDVIIGNPPYISRKIVENEYSIAHFESKFPDIYAYILMRSVDLLKCYGRIGMIVPLSLTFHRQYNRLRTALMQKCKTNWFSSYDKDPQSLFKGVQFRHTIHLGVKAESKNQ